jgi:hypothetical protein
MKVNIRATQADDWDNPPADDETPLQPRALTEAEQAEVDRGLALLAARPSDVVMMAPSELTISPEVQRRYRPKWGNKLASEFDVLKTGVLHANKRTSGEVVVLDGQHRTTAAEIAGYRDKKILKVNLYHGLTLAEEAAAFRALNNSRPVAATDWFHVGLTEGDPMAQGVAGIFTKYGLTVGKLGDSRSFQAVKTAVRVYGQQPDALDVAIGIVCDAWLVADQTPPRGWLNGVLVEGIARMVMHHGKKFNPQTMVHQLQGFGPGPWGLLGIIRGRKTTTRGSSAEVAEIVFTELYNKATRGKGTLAVPEKSTIEKTKLAATDDDE